MEQEEQFDENKLDIDFNLYGILVYGIINWCPEKSHGVIKIRRNNNDYTICFGKISMIHGSSGNYHLRICVNNSASSFAKIFAFKFCSEDEAKMVGSMFKALIKAINEKKDLTKITEDVSGKPIKIKVKHIPKKRGVLYRKN